MGKLLNALVVVGFFAAAWYVYTNWIESAADPGSESTEFNCRGALARLAEDYACRDDPSCTLSEDQVKSLRELEANIEAHCN